MGSSTIFGLSETPLCGVMMSGGRVSFHSTITG